MRSQKEEEEEEEGKCKEKQILLDRLVFMNPRSSTFMDRGEKSTLFLQGGGFFGGLGAYSKYYLRGAKLSQQAKWEFLLLCESAGIIFITPAAESDPGAAHIENSTCPVGISGELSL